MQGVELSHRAVACTVAGLHKYLQLVGCEMDCTDSEISYLPLAHIFDRWGDSSSPPGHFWGWGPTWFDGNHALSAHLLGLDPTRLKP